jgi:hypothetical protein
MTREDFRAWVLNSIPRQTQRQDSLSDQLADLRLVANRLGMYDAADWLSDQIQGGGIPERAPKKES